jgi:hypothetical protein
LTSQTTFAVIQDFFACSNIFFSSHGLQTIVKGSPIFHGFAASLSSIPKAICNNINISGISNLLISTSNIKSFLHFNQENNLNNGFPVPCLRPEIFAIGFPSCPPNNSSAINLLNTVVFQVAMSHIFNHANFFLRLSGI